MPTRLTDLEVYEVSLVKRGANRRKFLMLKSQGENMKDILKDIADQKVDEKQIQELVEKHCKDETKEKKERVVKSLIANARFTSLVKNDLGYELANKLLFGKDSAEGSDNQDDNNKPKEKVTMSDKEKAEKAEAEKVAKAATDKAAADKVIADKAKAEKAKNAAPAPGSDEITAIKKANEDLVKKNADLEKEIAVERNERIQKEFMTKAESFKHITVKTDELCSLLKEAKVSLSKESYGVLESLLEKSEEALKESALLKETGSGGGDGFSSTLQKVNALTAEIRKQDPKLTAEQAESLVWNQNPALYKAYNDERRGVQ